jgi:hypothetical protein
MDLEKTDYSAQKKEEPTSPNRLPFTLFRSFSENIPKHTADKARSKKTHKTFNIKDT